MSVLIVLYSLSINAQTTKVADVQIPNQLTAGKEKIILNGAGIRVKYFMDIYVCGLYLSAKSNDPQKIIEANNAMAIKIHIVSSLISSKKMQDAITEGFEKSTNNNMTPLKSKIDQMISAFSEEIKVGDEYDIKYTIEDGTIIYKNNIKKTQITGFDFKKALFGIWLGSEPADDDLKVALLGK